MNEKVKFAKTLESMRNGINVKTADGKIVKVNLKTLADSLEKDITSMCASVMQAAVECSRNRIEFVIAPGKKKLNCDVYRTYKKAHSAWFDWSGTSEGADKNGVVKKSFGEWLLSPFKERS